jgi:archaellum component FlaF (FlaF/FlaG flagellin family)
MTAIILSSALVISGVLFLTYFVKYKKLYKKVSKTLNNLEKPKFRKGYYKGGFEQIMIATNVKTQCDVIFMVKELEKYSNDMSKIELENIEIISGGTTLDRTKVIKYAKEQFSTLKKTSEITWLDVEVSIKEQRREKLNQLKEALK